MSWSHSSSHVSIPHWTADFAGEDMVQRERILDTIRDTYRQFGFDPLHTPALENARVFDWHHGEWEKLIFHLRDGGDNPLVLRYDLTVPLARVVSMYPDLPKPYKRYQIGNVFRDDHVDKWHFREFTQCDGDVVGNSSLTADADVIMLAHAGLHNLGFKDFVIRINHRRIIKALAEKAWINSPEGILAVQRALDFADKVIKNGIEWIRQDLETRWIEPSIIENIIRMVELKWQHQELLAELDEIFRWNTEGQQGIQELREIIGYLPPDTLEKVSIDFTLARGADYYTGFILEGVIQNIPVGAVLWWGRYDNLVSAFGQDTQPAVGMAFGFERIYTAMHELWMFQSKNSPESIRILVASCYERIHKIAFDGVQKLRKAQINADFIDVQALNGDIEALKTYMRKRFFSALVIFWDSTHPEIIEKDENNWLSERLKTILMPA